jgi:hypothetical protein
MDDLARRELVKAMARMSGLELPAERINQLTETYDDFNAQFSAVWEIDPGECEPAALTFDDEVPEA